MRELEGKNKHEDKYPTMFPVKCYMGSKRVIY